MGILAAIYPPVVRIGYKVRMPLSRFTNLFRNNSGEPLKFTDYEKFAEWFRANARWEGDELNGLLDNISTVGNMWAQWRKNGIMKGDCDDLANVSANVLKDMGRQAYIVTLTPRLGFKRPGRKKKSWGHVITVFKTDETWRVFSNNRLLNQHFDSQEAAILENGFYPKSSIILYEIRTHDLKLVRTVKV
ncbi:MAG: hypothetical protein ACE5HI_16390 [bacterium]